MALQTSMVRLIPINTSADTCLPLSTLSMSASKQKEWKVKPCHSLFQDICQEKILQSSSIEAHLRQLHKPYEGVRISTMGPATDFCNGMEGSDVSLLKSSDTTIPKSLPNLPIYLSTYLHTYLPTIYLCTRLPT